MVRAGVDAPSPLEHGEFYGAREEKEGHSGKLHDTGPLDEPSIAPGSSSTGAIRAP